VKDTLVITRERFTAKLDLSDGRGDVLIREGDPCVRASSVSLLPKLDNARSHLVPLTEEEMQAEFSS